MIYVVSLFALGVVVGEGLAVSDWLWGVVAVCGGVAGYICRRLPRWRWICLGLAILAGGGFWYEVRIARPEALLAQFTPGYYQMIGVVTGEPTPIEDGWRFPLRIEEPPQVRGVRWRGRSVQVTVAFDRRPDVGDRLWVRGYMSLPREARNRGEPDLRRNLREQGIWARLRVDHEYQIEARGKGWILPPRRWGLALRRRWIEVAQTYLPQDQASLLAAMIWGERGAVDEEMILSFRRAGAMHLMAVSGLHVGFVAVLLLGLFKPIVGEKWSIPMTAAGVLVFLLALDLRMAPWRAGLMLGLSLLAKAFDRPYLSTHALALAVGGILLVQPLAIFGVGLPLSVGAVLAILTLGPGLSRLLPGPRWLRGGLAYPLAAQMGVAPLSLWFFGEVSLLGPLANLLLVPMAGVALQLGLLAGLAGVLWEPLAAILSWPLRVPLSVLIHLASWFSGIEWAFLQMGRPHWAWVLLWLGLLAWLARSPATWERRGLGLGRWGREGLVLGLILLNIAVWSQAWRAFYPRTQLSFLDVGQGDAILITTPNGRHILIDGGGSHSSEERDWVGDWVLLPALRRRGVERVDWIILTHPHLDHFGGLVAVVEELEVGGIIEGIPGQTPQYGRFEELIASRGVQRVPAQAGQYLAWEGGRLEIWTPRASPAPRGQDVPLSRWENDQSVVTRLVFGGFSAIFLGDLEAAGMEGLFLDLSSRPNWAQIRSTVLKVPHHGSIGSWHAQLLGRIDPSLSVITVGRNTYGHPSEQVVAGLASGRRVVRRTDQDGEIWLMQSGTGLRIWTWLPRRGWLAGAWGERVE